MKKPITVTLNYARSSLGNPIVLPFRVLDSEGTLLAEGAARSSDPQSISVPADQAEPLFVRLTWPSGRTETKRVAGTDRVDFDDDDIAGSAWATWAVPRLNPESRLVDTAVAKSVLQTARIPPHDDNWMRLWRFDNGRWNEARIVTTDRRRDADALQIGLQLGEAGWCLQVGGPRVPWLNVVLPGSGACRVLVTPNDSSNPTALPLKVIVTGFRADAEMLMEFLTRDSIRAAKSVAEYSQLATNLVGGKYADPIAAAAGAYFLLRTRGWNSIPGWWLDNLSNDFPWLVDGALIRCVMLLRSGEGEVSSSKARDHLARAFERGLPVFAEASALLQEARGLLVKRNKADRELRAKIEGLVAAEAWAGAAFGLLGERPDRPSPEKVYGTPGKSKPAPSMPLTYFKDVRPQGGES
jgi:hypothetical protein